MQGQIQDRFLVITGTNREGSNSEKIANIYIDLLKEAGIHSDRIDLKDLPRDFAFQDMWNGHSETLAKMVQDKIEPATKYIFIIPEYNGGFPGVLKTFIDCIPPKVWNGKKAGLIGISSGAAGALRAMDQFTNVLNYLKVSVLCAKPKLSGIDQILQDEKLNDDRANAQLADHVQMMKLF